MGQSFEQENFTESEHQKFSQCLRLQLSQLKSVLQQDNFSDGPTTLGAELEMYLVDKQTLEPSPQNQALMKLCNDPQQQEELNRFNLEYNLSPVAAKGNPFAEMEKELRTALTQTQTHADSLGVQLVPIGILPTLREKHLQSDFMSDLPRYRALGRTLYNLRGSEFKIDINGEDPLDLACDNVTLEGANTSFQVHLKVKAANFAQNFNAAQLSSPLVLALSGNSPTLIGHRLWQETRIALFKQSIDSRTRPDTSWRQPARVSFGQGWVRKGAWELFAEAVALYPPIYPVTFENDASKDEKFEELCLHQGTVWPWNRPVYSHLDGGHLRIEFRYIPAGPTVLDMLANSALAIGLAIGLADQADDMTAATPFKYAEYNFYRAAQSGLEAKILWPFTHQDKVEEHPIRDVIKAVLPHARSGLAEIGVSNEEIDRLMSVIELRLETGQTGSVWQLKTLKHYQLSMSKPDAYHAMLKDYISNMHSGLAVAEWK